MTDEIREFLQPPVVENGAGEIRRVGFELEFSGLTLADTLAAVRGALDGEIVSETAAEVSLRTGQGDFNIEIDWDFLKRTAADEALPDRVDEWVGQLSEAAALLVPIEVVCPPIPINELGPLDDLVDALRAAGAVGTDESLIAAYGVHINPEIPALDAATIQRYLKAFVLLQWWLVDAHDVDTARKLSPYIDLYGQAYMKRVLTADHTAVADLIDDYLEHNPSRNRALDMLPMFAEIDEDRVRDVVSDGKVNARPTFHYRMPNCRIDDPEWRLSRSWNTWCEVEALAGDEAALDRLGEEFLAAERPLLGVERERWVARMATWIQDRA